MLKPVVASLLVSLFLVGGLFQTALCAGPESAQVILMPNEEYVGTIDAESGRYLQVTLFNLADGPSTCRIRFFKKKIELGPEIVGPAEFRTYTLEAKNARQTRIWSTLHFDEFTINVDTGSIQLRVEKLERLP